MTDVRSVGVAHDVGGPFELCRVGVTCADVAGLECLKVLLGAEFVGHDCGFWRVWRVCALWFEEDLWFGVCVVARCCCERSRLAADYFGGEGLGWASIGGLIHNINNK